jgi:SAM-dependent methyltransferase
MTDAFTRLQERYRSGDVPWDDALPPPEVVETLAVLAPGRALDLGTGYGRAALYMARHGWQVDAVDFVPEALAEAKRRADAAGVTVAFHQSDVTALDYLETPCAFVLDVGCGHALDADGWRRYHAQLKRLLAPGGVYLLFGRLRGDSAEFTPTRSGLDYPFVRDLLSDGFTQFLQEENVTHMPDESWSSGWFWFQRHMPPLS